MKKNEIQVGGIYSAKVSGRIVNVRVDRIREEFRVTKNRYYDPRNVYDVVNMFTGRKLTFRSAQKFRPKKELGAPRV